MTQTGAIPAGSAFRPGQSIRINPAGCGGNQQVIYDYASGGTFVSPYANSDAAVGYELPPGEWLGIFHYDYTDGRFTQAVYRLKLLH